MAYDGTKLVSHGGYTGLAFATEAITPHNDNDLATYAKITVVVAGNLVVIPANNDAADTVTITGAPVGYSPPFAVRRVKATGTTATVIALRKIY